MKILKIHKYTFNKYINSNPILHLSKPLKGRYIFVSLSKPFSSNPEPEKGKKLLVIDVSLPLGVGVYKQTIYHSITAFAKEISVYPSGIRWFLTNNKIQRGSTFTGHYYKGKYMIIELDKTYFIPSIPV